MRQVTKGITICLLSLVAMGQSIAQNLASPESAQALDTSRRFLMRHGLYEEALKVTLKSATIWDKTPEAVRQRLSVHRDLGWIYYWTHSPDKARTEFDSVLSLASTTTDAASSRPSALVGVLACQVAMCEYPAAATTLQSCGAEFATGDAKDQSLQVIYDWSSAILSSLRGDRPAADASFERAWIISKKFSRNSMSFDILTDWVLHQTQSGTKMSTVKIVQSELGPTQRLEPESVSPESARLLALQCIGLATTDDSGEARTILSRLLIPYLASANHSGFTDSVTKLIAARALATLGVASASATFSASESSLASYGVNANDRRLINVKTELVGMLIARNKLAIAKLFASELFQELSSLSTEYRGDSEVRIMLADILSREGSTDEAKNILNGTEGGWHIAESTVSSMPLAFIVQKNIVLSRIEALMGHAEFSVNAASRALEQVTSWAAPDSLLRLEAVKNLLWTLHGGDSVQNRRAIFARVLSEASSIVGTRLQTSVLSTSISTSEAVRDLLTAIDPLRCGLSIPDVADQVISLSSDSELQSVERFRLLKGHQSDPQVQKLLAQIAKIKVEINTISANQNGGDFRGTLQIYTLQAQLSSLDHALTSYLYSAQSTLKGSRSMSLSNVRRSLADDELLVQFHTYLPSKFSEREGDKTELGAFVISRDSVEFVNFGLESVVRQLASQLIDGLTSMATESLFESTTLYNMVWQKINVPEGIHHIYLSGDDLLIHTPWSVLLDEDDHFVAERSYAISSLLSPGDLLENRGSGSWNSVFVAATPVTSAVVDNSSRSKVNPHEEWTFKGSAYLDLVRAAFKSLPGAQITALIDDAVTQKSLLEKVVAPDLLIIQSHGELASYRPMDDPDAPKVMESVIALAAADFQKATAIPADDAYLVPEEVLDMDLDGTQLVILAACQSGSYVANSNVTTGDFVRAFRYAGSKSVIASVGKIPTLAARDLTIGILKQLEEHQKDPKFTPAMALHQAQRRVIIDSRQDPKGSTKGRPRNWGYFITYGR